MNWRCSWLLLLVLAPLSQAAKVDGVRVWRAPDHTRVVLDLSEKAEHKLFQLDNPDRLVVDIQQSSMKANLKSVDLSKTPIKSIRSGPRDKQHLRVVLDLSSKVKPRSFFLKRQPGKPDRLVIDLYDKSKSSQPTVSKVDTNTGKRNIIIAIDAGHGGEDPGAIGPKRTREKHVVLAISLELKKIIDRTPGYKAVMIRTGDYYVPLWTRRDKARQAQADLMVSIHADAFTNPKANGASVYALSKHGATSETAKLLAQRENQADKFGGVGNVSLKDKDKQLAGVLVDLSMNATMGASLDIGAHILGYLKGVARLHKKQVEQAGFVVLKSPDVPSILVETGFISNPGEERKLGSKDYRRKIASAVFKGLNDYFTKSPPPGTLLAARKSGSTTTPLPNKGKSVNYVIASGDTLSAIAQRYRVTVSAIRRANKLSSSVIKVGQRLRIPASGG